jgi:hypothetical protein
VSPQTYVEGWKQANNRAYTTMLREMEGGSGGVWSAAQGVSAVMGDITGYNMAFEAGFGVDRQHLTQLGTAERWTRGFGALSQMAGTVAGGLKGYNPAARSLRLSPRRSLGEPSGALTPRQDEICAKPRPDHFAKQERVEGAIHESRAAQAASRFEQFEARPQGAGQPELQSANAAKTTPRVFWSGGDVAREAAEAFAKRTGGTTLELANPGLQGISDAMLAQGKDWATVVRPTVWEPASKSFAEGASGVVNVFQNAEGVSLRSVWRQLEYPVLKNNPGVTIRYHIVMPDGSVVPVP